MLSTRWRSQPTAGGDAAAPATDIPQPEWDVLRSGRTNVLLEGEKSRIRQIIFCLASQVPRRTSWWQPGSDWPAAPHTIIIENVDALGQTDQCELFERLTRHPAGVQIVSTCSGSLYSAVRRGEFHSPLYYRLNMVRIDLR